MNHIIKQSLGLLTMLLSVQYVHAQSSQIEKETWAGSPAIHKIDAKYSKESDVIIFDKRRVEYIDEAKGEVAEYYTLHKIIHINNDRGIENYNRIYLGINDKADIVDVKARSILPNGKIVELDKSNIKDIKDKDDNVYKIFAMDGLEKGSEIEYYYTFKRPANFFGKEIIQGSAPVLESVFQLVAPKRLRFEIKPYNTDVTSKDTLLNDKAITECRFLETPGVDKEKYANYYPNLKRVEFKLAYNDAVNKGERLYTWNGLAKRIYGLYADCTDKETSAIADVVKKNGWDQLTDEVAKITAVENYVKKNFSYHEEVRGENENRVETILRNKNAGMIGIMRLYSGFFQNLNVNYQFVLTSGRDKYLIDKTFENWNNCDYPVFYFPAETKFLAPTRADLRYPWIPSLWGATNGMFCKHTTLGSFSTAIAEIKTVQLEDYTKSMQNMEATITFTKGLDSLVTDAKQIFGGYAASGYRDAFNYSNDEQRREILKELTKSYFSSETILSSEVLNQSFESQSTNLPLIVHIKAKSGAFIENAGNKLLLKIGLAIGPQVEMYQDKPRQQPVDVGFGHVEERRLDVTIPDGYKIRNINDLKIDQTYKENDELTMGFVSDYELKGNLLTIHIVEQYRKPLYPLTQFDSFRKIINASSDFNKVVLVLEKI
ncbi:DUF3857 domain-containing protein [Mucilaginibacter sp. FT3.2]|uniref:DUF3857 domain-containing protein n=1 Tax=Mucilaginibacter sp. FT3.2 TaxID=2723090 RepID=UPI00161DCA39|nr:DUF3857 domain-containing protein [Mucilaginibacter sp. FT3.2]MBB6233882.1 hypothetical protein [Mucilaginibacter sp. FT3.2]